MYLDAPRGDDGGDYPGLDDATTWASHVVPGTAQNRDQPRTEGAFSTRVLETKLLVPSLSPNLVDRPRLFARLDEGLSRPLILVSGGPGFGKTTIVSHWIRSHGLRAAWLALDAADSHPDRYWAYVLAALHKASPELQRRQSFAMEGDTPAGDPGAGQEPLTPIHSLVFEAVNILAKLSDETVLVLDDYHLIDALPVHETMALFLKHLPPSMRVVITTRGQPPLSLEELRARGQAAEISESDLRFTEEEANAFLRRALRMDVTGDAIRTLWNHTEGWAAGLQLASLTLGQADTEVVEESARVFSGASRHVFRYLVGNILRTQPEETQSFLRRTSILERLNCDLCDAIMQHADARHQLQRLFDAGLFLTPLDQDGCWYRYHTLFAEALRSILQQEADPDQVRSLHRSAGAWLDEHGFLEEAIEHSLAAKDFERAARLIELTARPSDFFIAPLRKMHWINSLPEAEVTARPSLYVARVWHLVGRTGEFAAARESLSVMEKEFDLTTEMSDDQWADMALQRRFLMAHYLAMKGSLETWEGHPRSALALMDRLSNALSVPTGLEEVGRDSSLLRFAASFVRGVALLECGDLPQAETSFLKALAAVGPWSFNIAEAAIGYLGRVQAEKGQLLRARETYARALGWAAAHSSESSPLASVAEVGMADLAYEWNELDAAEAQYRDGIATAQKIDAWEVVSRGMIGLVRIGLARGDWAQSEADLQDLTFQSLGSGTDRFEPLIEAWSALSLLAQGDILGARALATAFGPVLEGDRDSMSELQGFLAARLLLAEGRPDESLRLIDELLGSARAGRRVGQTIELLALRSLALDAASKPREARATLIEALMLAEPEGYVRTVVDAGGKITDLLSSLLMLQAGCPVSRQYLQTLLGADAGARRGGSPRPGENPLTKGFSAREREVLRLVAEGQTNPQIAVRLFISVNTVKVHVRNLFRKLDAHDRGHAVEAGRELGLLPYSGTPRASGHAAAERRGLTPRR